MYTQASTPKAARAAATRIAGRSPFAKAVLYGATALTGLATGAMALYAHTIMPGLKQTDDRTFVGAFQSMDRAITTPPFMLTFFGALILIGVAALQHRGAGRRTVFGWLTAAFVLYLINVVITMGVNVPLNDALRAAGDPAHINVAAARAAFHESTWAAWNYVRTIASAAAFVILLRVLAEQPAVKSEGRPSV